ncbi:MAG: GIY-YIG nuclease family protein [Balneola sp.]
MAKTYYMYLLSNISKMIYIGVTNNLERRVFEHKSKQRDGFTKKYNLHQLVYYEETDGIGRAIEKGWTRQKKVALIESIKSDMERFIKGLVFVE